MAGMLIAVVTTLVTHDPWCQPAGDLVRWRKSRSAARNRLGDRAAHRR
jgi:hypothetical protein